MGTKTNPFQKEKYKKQFAITEKNKIRTWLKHLKKHPNDAQTKAKV